jgi:hypothetical protein
MFRCLLLLLIAMPSQQLSGGDWARRPGVDTFFFYAWGSGGQGGASDFGVQGGGGGGSGSYADKTVTGTPLDDLYYIDNVSSQPTVSTGAAFPSGTVILSAPAGSDSSDPSGAAGGTGGTGDTVTDGNAGDDGQVDGSGGAAGKGGDAPTGSGLGRTGGTGGNGTSGDPGNDPGGGGQGRRDDDGSPHGGAGGAAEIWADWTDPIIDMTTQPANVNSGSPLSTFTARIKFASGTPDTNASTAPAGNTCTVTVETGSGTITAGTTSRAYGTGADGSKANFDDIVITGSGSHTLRITDDVSGAYVVTSSFTVTAAAFKVASVKATHGVLGSGSF